MDVAWQDGAGSFLDWSGSDLSSSFASLASGDGSVLWSSSGDTPVFSGDSVLWESSADSPSDRHLTGLTLDDAGGTDTVTPLVNSWIADGTPRLAGGMLDTGLLWAGAGSDTSSSLASNGGVGLGALDLSAGTGSSQWQQFVGQFASPAAAWVNDVPHLVWAGASTQPPLIPTVAPDALHLASSAAQTFPTMAPEHILWTDPSAATGLIGGPSVVDVAPPTPISGVGIISQSTNALPISGAGSR